MADIPIIDLQSDHYFMGEALRQAKRAYEAEEVPVIRHQLIDHRLRQRLGRIRLLIVHCRQHGTHR